MSLKVNAWNARLGDGILIEPAISAWAEKHQDQVELYANPIHRPLFEHNPAIRLVDEPHAEPDIVPNPTLALQFAWFLKVPFGAGYFQQFGLHPHGRLHYEIFGEPFQETPERLERILIVPYARSCSGHAGKKPNIQPSPEWWLPILERLPLPAYTMGTSDDATLPFTQPLKDLGFRQMVWEMRRSRLLISIETGPLHLASTAKVPTIFLSSATAIPVSKPNTDCQVIRHATPEWDQEKVIAAIHTACDSAN